MFGIIAFKVFFNFLFAFCGFEMEVLEAFVSVKETSHVLNSSSIYTILYYT